MDVPLLSPPAIPLIGDLLRYTISPLIGRMIWPLLRHRLFSPAQTPQRFLTQFPVWMTLRPLHLRSSAAETALLIPSAFSLRKRHHELSVPAVLVAGADDKYLNTHVHSERLHHDLTQSEYHAIPGAGHMVHHLALRQVMSAIDQAAETAALPVGQQPAPAKPAQFGYYGS